MQEHILERQQRAAIEHLTQRVTSGGKQAPAAGGWRMDRFRWRGSAAGGRLGPGHSNCMRGIDTAHVCASAKQNTK